MGQLVGVPARPRRERHFAPAMGLAAQLGRGTRRVVTDAVIGRSARLPRRVADLTEAHLTRLLGRRVERVTVVDGDAGTSSRARLALDGDGVPSTVFVKMPAETVATRFITELGRLAETETRFYSEVAPQLRDVPQAHATAFDPLTKDQAVLLVELLARVHAVFWERLPTSRKAALGWVYSASEDPVALLTGRLLRMSAKRLADKTEIPVDRGRFIDENYGAVASLIDSGPQTLMHGDAHPGNVYFRNGRAGLLDWQAIRRGHVSRELSYSLISGMTTADRQRTERDLLDTYRQAVRAAGGPDLDREDLWTRYRQSALYVYTASAITAGLGGMQDDAIALAGLARAVAALEDLDTVAALRAAL
ncbi:phosphotransferase [Mycolicibacter senuensis]|uniref:phosphotransferase n=1 Tax=Mycolicibacter senuensis TaxID=386913 RepID=UPI000DCC03BA|nr:phosphotransferase [Mycolicibacter senuensis]RAV03252.1 phosphotransferase [Mycolicibacter senuensis]